MEFSVGDKVRLLAGARPSGSDLVCYIDSEGLFEALNDAGISKDAVFVVMAIADKDNDVEIRLVGGGLTEIFYVLPQYLVHDYGLGKGEEEFVGKILRANKYVDVDSVKLTKLLDLARELK